MTDAASRADAGVAGRLPRAVGRLTDAVGRAAAWLNVGMVAATCAVVGLRYALDTGSIPLQESVLYMHAAAFLLGLSYALRHDAHVRVDVLYSRLGERGRGIVNLVGHLLLLAPLCLVVIAYSVGYVARSWAILEGSPEVAGLPAVFLLKTLIPLSMALLALQALALAAREASALAGVRAAGDAGAGPDA